MGRKNAYLARLQAVNEAEKEEALRGSREAQKQIQMISMLLAAHNALQVGPGRAGRFLAEFIRVEREIAENILSDVGEARSKKNGLGDPEFQKTKKDLAMQVKAILSPEDWVKFQKNFPVLAYYWEAENVEG